VRKAVTFTLVLLAVAAASVLARGHASDAPAQRRPYTEYGSNSEYDGRLVFVRVYYSMGFSGGFGGRFRGSRGEPPWAHDYPTSDTHLMKILNELTVVRPRIDGSNILGLDDPELFDYPIAYMSEPGHWAPNDKEVAGLREYLLKGGFIIFDDFREEEGHWDNLEAQMKRVLPENRWFELDHNQQIFHSFFEIDALDLIVSYGRYRPSYWGLFENNDPKKRLLAIANNNNDLGEFWEFSDTGRYPVDLSNESYKFGVNYFIYGLIH
jgi:hypothetical protein